jgi:hypothetical protein
MLKKVFGEYGDAIGIAIAVILLIGIIVVLLSVDGPVKTAFNDLLSSFFTKASAKGGI